jgi:hypothetical protein
MSHFILHLIGECRTIRRVETVVSTGGKDLWRVVTSYAACHGSDGEHVQVFDEHGGMVIRVGVSTARTATTTMSVAA